MFHIIYIIRFLLTLMNYKKKSNGQQTTHATFVRGSTLTTKFWTHAKLSLYYNKPTVVHFIKLLDERPVSHHWLILILSDHTYRYIPTSSTCYRLTVGGVKPSETSEHIKNNTNYELRYSPLYSILAINNIY